ncbi:unnamed protein product [marine sediment metagenome]|uniref:Uncharacterized protein n=1 Tax=marine sediment metagenome TaxID=412755 RepID=X1AB25_9ZZZZ
MTLDKNWQEKVKEIEARNRYVEGCVDWEDVEFLLEIIAELKERAFK